MTQLSLISRRTFLYGVVYIALIGLPQIGLLLMKPILQQTLGAAWWRVPFFVILTTAIVAPFVYTMIQRRAQILFLQEQRRALDSLIRAAQGMTLVKDLRRLLNLIVHILSRSVRSENASVWLLDTQTSHYVLHALRATAGIKAGEFLPADHPLMEYLLSGKRALSKEELTAIARRTPGDRLLAALETMKLLRAVVVIPSFVEERMIGFVTLGERLGGKPYTQDDLDVFQVLANQAALAIENAQFYEELKHTQADLFQTAKMASLGHMAGGMSHQINNRFHVLTILAGTMKSTLTMFDPATMEPEKLKEFWEKTVEALTKIEENALRGGDIVKTLLKFSRPAGEYKPVKVEQILSTAKEVVQFRVNQGVFDIIEQIPNDLPPVKGDLNQLADCCINLIANAFDATQKKAELIQAGQLTPAREDAVPYRGQISIHARHQESLNGSKSMVILEIRDNGTGINKADLQQMFVPFFTTKATVEKGTGLGLYIIQRIIEQHGGTIGANSDYGHGTLFTIQLPVMESGS